MEKVALDTLLSVLLLVVVSRILSVEEQNIIIAEAAETTKNTIGEQATNAAVVILKTALKEANEDRKD